MLRMKKKIIPVIILLLLGVCMMDTKVYAAQVSVTAIPDGNGGYSVGVDSPYTGGVDVSTSDGGYVQFWCENNTCSVTQGSNYFTGSGNVSVTATPINPMSDANGGKVNADGAKVSIQVPSANTTTSPSNKQEQPQEDGKEPDPKSTDSTLASLHVSDGKLSPAFTSQTLEYTLDLGQDVKEITISAAANDPKASVTGNGKISVKPGNNDISIICNAEDGSTSEYVIHAKVKETAAATFSYQGKTLEAMLNTDEAQLQNKAFEKTTITVKGVELPAWISKAQNLTLLYLKAEKEYDFYIFDEDREQVTSIYRPMGILGKNIVMIDIPEALKKREGMHFTMVDINKTKMPGWTFDDTAFADFALIYVMDAQGNTMYYQYSKTDNSLQLYSGAAAITQEAYTKLLQSQKEKEDMLLYTIYGLAAGCVVLLLSSVYLYVKRKRKGPKYAKISIEKEDYVSQVDLK